MEIKQTPLVKALNIIEPRQNISLRAPIRDGKTFATCYLIAKTNDLTALFIVRTHEQAKEVNKRLTALGVNTAHVAGVRWKDFHYNLPDSALSLTPRDLWRILAKKRRRDIVGCVKQMVRDGLIRVMVTVPEIAIHFDPQLFDILVLDEEQVVNWFKPESQLLFSYDRDFGKYTEDSPIERAYTVLNNLNGKFIKQWCEWAKEVDELIKSYRTIKNTLKTQGEPEPEKKALEEIELRLYYLMPVKWFKAKYNIDLTDGSKIVKAIEYVKKKAKANDQTYEALNLAANSLAFMGFNAFTTKDGGRVWGILNNNMLLFKEWLNGFKHIWVITNKTSDVGEWLFKNLDREFKLIYKDSFRFERNFVSCITSEQFEIAKELSRRGTPTAWVTGRKRDAYKLKHELREHGIKAIVAEEHTKEEIEDLLKDGYQIILYLNSRVSKGIDLPLIQVVFVYNYGFAVPNGNAIKTMRDELEQVILRCSPVNDNDFMLRFIVWCSKSERTREEQEFITAYLNEKADNDEIAKGYDIDRLFKSNWLPLSSITMLPIPVSARSFAKLNQPLLVSLERSNESIDWDELSNMASGQTQEIVIANNSEELKLSPDLPLPVRMMLLYANDENEKGLILKLNKSALVRFWNKVKGKTMTATETRNTMRECSIRREAYKSYLLNVMERAGLLTRQRQGRKVIYSFVNTDYLAPPKPPDDTKVKHMIITEQPEVGRIGRVKVAVEEPPEIASGPGGLYFTPYGLKKCFGIEVKG